MSSGKLSTITTLEYSQQSHMPQITLFTKPSPPLHFPTVIFLFCPHSSSRTRIREISGTVSKYKGKKKKTIAACFYMESVSSFGSQTSFLVLLPPLRKAGAEKQRVPKTTLSW